MLTMIRKNPRFMLLATVWLNSFVAFHTLDQHIVWINSANVLLVRGAGQIGYQNGTLLHLGGVSVVVAEDVVEVVKRLEGKTK